MLGLLEKKDEQLCVGGKMLFRISGTLQVYLAVVKILLLDLYLMHTELLLPMQIML